MRAGQSGFSFTSVAVAVYLPTLLYGIGEGALVPLIPAAASGLGATLALAGMIAAMLKIGELVGDLPSGVLVARVGERTAMLIAIGVSVVAAALMLFSPVPLLLGIGVFVLGLATAVFALARHSFMTTYVPVQYRARSLSLLGGFFRGGRFLGPLLSAPVIHLSGGMTGVYVTMMIFCAAAALVLIILPDPETVAAGRRSGTRASSTSHGNVGVLRTVADSRRVLGTVGVGASILSALRAARMVIIPLWAVSIGVDDATTSLVVGIAGGVDFALFYISGHVMDRFGRLWGAVPPMLGLGLGLFVLSITHARPDAFVWMCVAAGILAFSNGMSSGILMTLGADLADPGHPAPFLGAWRFVTDTGAASSPLIISMITALVSLPVASAALGGLGAVGAAMMLRYLPRYVSRPGRTRFGQSPSPRS